jgi:hypothetical protein
MWKIGKGSRMERVGHRVRKFAMRSLLIAGATTILASVAFVPTADAQVAISINPPVCSYGYYGYAPYGCAPSGYYGPGYFYNGIFLGVGPWASWGYGHGWGSHRFVSGGGGTYRGVSRNERSRGYSGNRGHAAPVHRENRANATRNSHAAAQHGGVSHGPAHAAAPHRGGESHGEGERH